MTIHFSRRKYVAGLLATATLVLWLSGCAGNGTISSDNSSNNTGGSRPTQLLYVTAPQVAGGGDNGTSINAFRVAEDGSLTPLGTALQIARPLRLAFADSNGHHVFGVLFEQTATALLPTTLATFAVQPGSGVLQQTSTTAMPANTLLGPMVFTASGTLIVALLQDLTTNMNTIALYSVDSAGNLALKHATVVGQLGGIAANPSGTFLYSMDLSNLGPSVIQFAVAADGSLTRVKTVPLSVFSTDLAMTPNGRTLYAEQFSGPQFQILSVDPISGSLSQGATVDCICGGTLVVDEGVGPAVNAKGTLLLTSTSGETLAANGIAIFTIDQNTGMLTEAANSFISLPGPGFPSFVFGGGGNLLYANAEGSGRIMAFSISDNGVVMPVPTQAIGFVQQFVNFTP